MLGGRLAARAQNFDFANDRTPLVALKGMWRFHTGDNPAWARPDFDDSHWTLLKADEPWDPQGYKGYLGVAWYRFAVTLPAKHGPMALYVPEISDSYQIFANGRVIGQEGGLPPRPELVLGPPRVVAIPSRLMRGATKIEFAIRVWSSGTQAAPSQNGGPVGVTWIGSAEAIRNWASLQAKYTFWSNADVVIEGLMYLGVCLGSLGLFFLGPGEREYLWFGLSQLGYGAFSATALIFTYKALPVLPEYVINSVEDAFFFGFLIMFLYALLGRRVDWPFRVGIGFVILRAIVVPFIPIGTPLFASIAGVATNATILGLLIIILLILYAGMKKGQRDALLLLVVYSVITVMLGSSYAIGLGATLHLPMPQELSGKLYTALWDRPFPVNFIDLVQILMESALLGILVMRFARTRKDEQRLAGELEAARSVQRVLVPEVIPEVPGYGIEAAYRPAREVGGDFFQIARQKNGDLLAVIGDVSGKGVGAGMTVSLLVGTFRALAEYEHRPAALLRAMNERMAGRTGGGFTTCMILRASADGRLVMANAGHLHPYVDGQEIEVEGGLPLGIVGEAEYGETELELAEGSRLTLLTDGVVEARDARTGELLGFDRTRELVGQSAEGIVSAAQEFGQEDDITVVTLTRLRVAEAVRAGAVEPVLSPV